jgi:hypothetical protein
MLEKPEYWISLLGVAVASGVGAFFGAYLKQKMQNLATKQDIGEITERAKRIEGKISDEFLTQQRNRDVRREVIFDLVKEVSALQYNLLRFSQAFALVRELKKSQCPPEELERAVKRREDETERYTEQLDLFWKHRALAAMVCGKALVVQVETINSTAILLWNRSMDHEAEEVDMNPLSDEIYRLTPLIRKELEMD